MASPTTERYPFLLQAAVPDDLAWEVYAYAYTRDLTRSDAIRVVVDAGLAALSPSYKEQACREVRSGPGVA